ncbi:MAG: hypothetical protein CUN49_10300 [Candidatus Thermofonsia Clade 1 bacterium]|jgi:hypothetical protein|uniref:Adhesin domain-containing protein n=1 Tax=Candidatus Thermofonsia Clade 1 bacterium TaxID=2364210 RepID=A0A2M8PZB3_9CHLR|nr:MAG: hypothetical protein CUN49_10300 [Candidatus Thermofonsia Clade 1 bacterium]PJF42886.1 MAG: hypothetical protein CUN50_02510 [Candidatus Thermofonsia Clade 1 bacterium]RMF51376.1 MAG: hypothetical protein D6749_07960 [Chloroflexota bacterium]
MTALDRLSLPAIVLIAAGLWIARLLNLIPTALADLLSRAAPALLIALGLALLLGRRARYGNLIALSVTAGLVGLVAAISFNREANLFREDYVETLEYTLPPNVTSVRLSADLRRTEVAVRSAEGRNLSGEFRGSLESLLTPSYRVEGDTAILELQETQREALLKLDQIGRGRLVLNLPANVIVASLTVNVAQGDLMLEAEQLVLRDVRITLASGNLSAQFGRSVGLLADLKASGDITVRVPSDLAAEIALRGSGANAPRFDEAIYTRRIDNVLVPSVGETQAQLTLEASGTITVE